MNTVPTTNNSNVVTKRIFNKKTIAHFNKYLKNQTWDNVHNQNATEQSFTWFQRVIGTSMVVFLNNHDDLYESPSVDE